MVNSPVTNSAIKPAQTGSQALNAQNQNSNVVGRVSYNQTTTNSGTAENSRISQIASTSLPGIAAGMAMMPFNPLLGMGIAGMGMGSGLRNAWNNSGAEPAKKENSALSRGGDEGDDSSGGGGGGGSNHVGPNTNNAPGAHDTNGLFKEDTSTAPTSGEKTVAALDPSDSGRLQSALNGLLESNSEAQITDSSETSARTEDGKNLVRASSQNGNSTLLILGAMNASDKEFLKANTQGLNVINLSGAQEKSMRQTLSEVANSDLANSRVVLIDTRKADNQTKDIPSSVHGGEEISNTVEQAKENNAPVDSKIDNTVTNIEKPEIKETNK